MLLCHLGCQQELALEGGPRANFGSLLIVGLGQVLETPALMGSPLYILGFFHEIPSHLYDRLPLFFPNSGKNASEHVETCRRIFILLQVQHEDVVCQLFIRTLQGTARQWYDNLPLESIYSWMELEIF